MIVDIEMNRYGLGIIKENDVGGTFSGGCSTGIA